MTLSSVFIPAETPIIGNNHPRPIILPLNCSLGRARLWAAVSRISKTSLPGIGREVVYFQ